MFAQRVRSVVGLVSILAFGLLSASATAATSTVFGEAIPAGTRPLDITTGPDGALWFTGSASASIGRITTSGAVTAITPGADGNLWFAAHTGVAIGRITPAGIVTPFPLATGPGPIDITAGPLGRLWYARDQSFSIDSIATDGTLGPSDAVTGPRLTSAIASIAAGPGGTLWATAPNEDRILRLTPGPEPAVVPVLPRLPVVVPVRTAAFVRAIPSFAVPTLQITPVTAIRLTTARLNAMSASAQTSRRSVRARWRAR